MTHSLIQNEFNQTNTIFVIIDVFRAFTTAGYVLNKAPSEYILAKDSEVLSLLKNDTQEPLLIGKYEVGADLKYDIPNSPTRVDEGKISNRQVLHRTEAGARGVLQASEADVILCAGFCNAQASVDFIKKYDNPRVVFCPMGHEATTPTLEDHTCALYLQTLLQGVKLDLSPFDEAHQKGSGKYFFSEDQWQYPREDFQKCLEVDRFDFAIRASLKENYALLTRCEKAA